MHIRSDDKTGYAVAEFYYQTERNQKSLFNALENARQFIKMKNKDKA